MILYLKNTINLYEEKAFEYMKRKYSNTWRESIRIHEEEKYSIIWWDNQYNIKYKLSFIVPEYNLYNRRDNIIEEINYSNT